MSNPIRRLGAVGLLLAGTFVATSAAFAAPADAATAHFEAVTPVRLLDTRDLAARPLAMRPFSVPVGSVAGVPAGATAAVVNVTVTQPAAAGWVSAWPTGQPWPGTSNINVVSQGHTVAGTITVMLGADGAFQLQASTRTNIVVDLLGVYVADNDEYGAGRFTPITPTRALDTRDAANPLSAGMPRVADLASAGVPADATGVVLTIAATSTAGPGFMTVWPGRGTAPWTSALNFDRAGRTVSNQVVVGVVSGEVSIQSSTATDAIVDVVGYFSPAEGGLFVPAAPHRVLDTRNSNSVTDGRPVVAAAISVANPATVVVGVVTVTRATAGYVTVWPTGTERPTISSANADGTSATVATQFTAATGDGSIDVYVSGSAHLVVDTLGTYTPARPRETTPTTTTTTTTTTTPTTTTTIPTVPDPTAPVAGAQLPIGYDLAAEPNKLYVATSGLDTNSGTLGAPLATLSAAVTKAPAGIRSTIVVRGGTYRQGQHSLPTNKQLTIIAYPGETPVFNGAQPLAGAWTSAGALRWHPYTDIPVTDGSGISFTTGQNLTGDGVGRFADQAWIGDTQLRQVTTQAAVVSGTFWVDAANDRIFLTATDSAASDIEASKFTQFLAINGPATRVEGLTIRRYSNHASLYGVILVIWTADGSTLRNVRIEDSAYQAIQLGGHSSGDILDDVTIAQTTIVGSNWMGIATLLTDDATIDRTHISGINRWDEFTTTPQSGALKTSRTWRTTVSNSVLTNNRVHGLWFDQSNYDAVVTNNDINVTVGTGVFFEISDRLTLVNNRITATGNTRALKIAGSSGVRIVNNTFVGGADPVGIYVDTRSQPGCADPSEPLCAGSYSSERDTVHPRLATLDWMPRVDLMLNNIIAYPTATGYCGGITAVCVTAANGTATASLTSVLHPAEPGRGIPATVIDGNVYAVDSGHLMRTERGSWSTIDAIRTGLSTAPMTVAGVEPNGRAGAGLVTANGTPTATLAAAHNQAAPVPTDASINDWIPAGTRFYGASNTATPRS